VWRIPLLPNARSFSVMCTESFTSGFTSNMISCGVREIIRYVVKHRMVDYIVTTGGGIEEDFMKCMNPHFMGDFKLKGEELRKKGINRIGNLLVPNKNYCAFEDWLNPILDQMLVEQKKDGIVWSPSKIINRLGKEINNEESVYYWCWKNDIPVFCPAITDGSVGDMIYFHSYKNPGLVVDIASDIRRINDAAIHAIRSGMLILGGGLVKHHICNANLMRNGADYSVFVNTGHEFDGSDSGAAPDEAVSWGKIKMTATPVKVCGDASFIFPLLAAQTFVDAVQTKRGRAEKIVVNPKVAEQSTAGPAVAIAVAATPVAATSVASTSVASSSTSKPSAKTGKKKGSVIKK